MAANPKTLKSRARALLLQKYKQRGGHRSNLWLFYSRKTKLDWVVTSDLEFDHAIWLEASPEVVRFDLAPAEIIVKVGVDDHMTAFDAMVWFSDKGPEAREVKPQGENENPTQVRTLHQREAQVIAATQLGATRRVVTGDDMAPHEMLIVNWRRVLSYLSAARDYPMGAMVESAALQLHAHPDTTIGELLVPVPAEDHSTFLAAVFALHQDGHYLSDLHQKPLSLATRIWRAEVQS